MLKTALCALAIAGPALLGATSHAGEPVDGPSGTRCGFSSITNPTAEEGTKTGMIDGGPLLIVDAEGNVGSGTLTCTIRVNAGSGPSVFGSGTGVVVIPTTVVSYQADDDDLVYLCTKFRYDNGTTLYYHSSEDPTVESHWTTDPNYWCGPPMTSGDGGNIEPPLRPIEELSDSLICPVLALVFPPQGDIPGIWDCPPYDT